MDRLPARQPPAHAPGQSRWFVVRLKDMGFGGPIGTDAVRAALAQGTLLWTDIAFVEGAVGTWKRLYEIEALRAELPPLPDAPLLRKYSERAAPPPNPATPVPPAGGGNAWFDLLTPLAAKVPRANWKAPHAWYLLLDGREVGPVDLSQVDEVSKRALISASAYAWTSRLRRWTPFAEIPELAKYVGAARLRLAEESSLVIERGAQKRRSPRKSLVAAVFQRRADGASEMMGICGDVSPDGFQLFQNERPVEYITGTRVNIEIRVSKVGPVPSFRANAVVKWFDPAKKIVGFEFLDLDAEDRKLLERFTTPSR